MMAMTLDKINAVSLTPFYGSLTPGQKVLNVENLTKKIKNRQWPSKGMLSIQTTSNHSFWQFNKGLPAKSTDPIFIYSGPRNAFLERVFKTGQGNGFRCVHPWLKNGIITTPVVTFDYFYDASDFDFGLGINREILHMIIKQTFAQNEEAPLILAGTCIGSKIILETMAKYKPNAIKALILESPFIDSKKMVNNIANYYSNKIPFIGANGIQSTISWYLPQYQKIASLPPSDLSLIPSDIPIFIAHRYNDSYYANQDMFVMNQELRKNNRTVYLLVMKNNRHAHGHLSNQKEFALAINAFLQTHNLACNDQLAKQGKQLLNEALNNAQAYSPSDWKIIAL